MRRRVVSCALTLGSILLMSGPARAASLSDQLDRFLQDNAGLRAGEFDQSMHPFADTAVPVLQKLEVRGADFPVTSTSPGFSFRYNPELGMFEPATASLGPVFVDRADTLGRGRLDVGATYLFARLTELQGGDLNTSSDTHDLANVFRNGTFSIKKHQNGLPFGEKFNLGAGLGVQICTTDKSKNCIVGEPLGSSHFYTDDFALEQHVLNLSATYGLTDRWDVNLLVPIVGTRLIVSGHRVLEIGVTAQSTPLQVTLSRPLKVSVASLDVNHEGIGDVQLRTKYYIGQELGVKFAGLLALRPPTGNENDFQGIGDFTVTPSLVMSREFGRNDFHLSLGTEVDTQDVSQSRARYALGVTLQPLERAAVLFDFIGNSSFVDDQFEFTTPVFQISKSSGLPGFGGVPAIRAPSQCTKTMCTQFGFIPRTDILDLAMGFKFLLVPGRAVAHLGVIKPINSDGLRAEVIPTGSVEVAF